jgi:hypothetical protein
MDGLLPSKGEPAKRAHPEFSTELPGTRNRIEWETLPDKKTKVVRLVSETDELLGEAVLWISSQGLPGTPNTAVLSKFEISASRRGEGLGSLFAQYLGAYLKGVAVSSKDLTVPQGAFEFPYALSKNVAPQYILTALDALEAAARTRIRLRSAL